MNLSFHALACHLTTQAHFIFTTLGQVGAVDKVASENQQWEFEQKKRRSLASFRVPYQPLQVQSGR